MQGLYAWLMRLSGSPSAPWALFAVAFAESSFFPLPPDIMLVPMVLARRTNAWRYALIATVGSVLGGIAGYAIGYYFYETIGAPLVKLYGKPDSFDQFTQWFREYGVWILIIKGMTPIPYKLLTITAGVAKMDLVAFVGASIIARAMRFLLVAGLLYWFGPAIRDFIEKRLALVTTLIVVGIVAGFVVVKYVL